MALFRRMRVSGVAVFSSTSASAPIIVPPPGPDPSPTGMRAFQVMYASTGAALLRGAPAATTGPTDPGGYVPKAFEEQVSWPLDLDFQGGNANEFSDVMGITIGLGFTSANGLELTEELRADVLLACDVLPQVSITLEVEARITMDFTARARLRGWNSDEPKPPKDWKPDPKPNLF